jgi:hypothetical protein
VRGAASVNLPEIGNSFVEDYLEFHFSMPDGALLTPIKRTLLVELWYGSKLQNYSNFYINFEIPAITKEGICIIEGIAGDTYISWAWD